MTSEPLAAVPGREVCVARYLVQRNAAEHGDRPFLVFPEGPPLTWRGAHDRVVQIACGLARLGVRQGEHVLSWLPTGTDSILLMLALNHLGAVYVPVNLAYRGRLLEHVVRLSDARLMVAHADLVPRLQEVDLARLESLVVLAGAATAALASHGPEALAPNDRDLPPLERPIEPWDTQTVIFTSGTTGPSKAVLSSYCQGWSMMGPEAWPFITDVDRYFMTMPMFHVGGTGLVNCMTFRGGALAVVPSFDTESFWPLVRRTEATVVFLLGAMASFLWKRPPGPEDRDHALKLAFMVPLVDDVPGFAARFGIDVRTVFNMTEINNPIVSEPQPQGRGFCGRMRPGSEARLVDVSCTHTALSPQGDLYVSDGYGNARVHKFAPDGTLLLSFGAPGTDPGQFNIPHNVCCDADGWVYVADRENHRIQVFDGNGRYEAQWNDMHRPSGLYMERGPHPRFYVGEIGGGMAVNYDMPNIGPRISIYNRAGEVLARLGHRPAGLEPGQFISPHGLAVDSHGDIYVGEVSFTNWGNRYKDQAPPPGLRSLQKLVKMG